jgi:hypothetical protein
MFALALTLGCVLSLPHAGEEPFLPCFEHARKPAREWMKDFEASGGNSLDALWCIYWSQDRSNEVVDFLTRWRDRCASGACSPIAETRWAFEIPLEPAREIDAILSDWQIPVAPLPPEWPAEHGASTTLASDGTLHWRSSTGRFPFPVAPLEGDEPNLFANLAQEDRLMQARAALALVVQGSHAMQALDTLVERTASDMRAEDTRADQAGWASTPISSTTRARRVEPDSEITRRVLEWLLQFGGSTGTRAIAAYAAKDEDHASIAARILGEPGPGMYSLLRLELGPSNALDEIWAVYAVRRDDFGSGMWRRLKRDSDVMESALWDIERIHRHDAALRFVDDPTISERLARVQRAKLDAAIAAGDLRVEEVEDAGRLALLCPAVRDAVEPALRGLLKREGKIGRAALRALCHLGVDGDDVRAAYVACVSAWKSFSDEALAEFPCLTKHDERTRATLERVIDERRGDPAFSRALQVAGLVDSATSRGAQRVMEFAHKHSDAVYGEMFRAGLLGRCPRVEGDDLERRVAKLGIELRTRKARGENMDAEIAELLSLLDATSAAGDTSDAAGACFTAFDIIRDLGFLSPKLANWCLRILLDPNHDGDQAEMIYGLLARRELDGREQAIACRAALNFGDDSTHSSFFARFGHAAMERAARIRSAAQRHQSLDELRDLLRISRPGVRDLEMLAAALTRGFAWDRRTALAILAEHPDIDAPSMRAAVKHALADLDDEVRRSARALQSSRGW